MLYKHLVVPLIHPCTVVQHAFRPLCQSSHFNYDDPIFKWKTSVKCKALAPVYDERFECKVTEEISRGMDKIIISL